MAASKNSISFKISKKHHSLAKAQAEKNHQNISVWIGLAIDEKIKREKRSK